MLSTNQQQKSKSTSRRFTAMASVMLGATLTLTACGGHDEEVKAVDKVGEAAELAQQNAPQPEPMPVEETTAEAESAEATEAEVAATDETATAEETDTEATGAEGEAAPLAADAGKQLYESTCKACHEGGLLGAPKFGNAADWEPRIAQGKETLYKHSAEGFNQMPPQATGDVSVEQVHAAVDYMVSQAS